MSATALEHQPRPTSFAGYAFAGIVFSLIAYNVFLIWAFVPATILASFGITYAPSQYYAIALPAYAIACFLFVVVFYISLNMLRTPSNDDLAIFEDACGNTAPKAFVRCGTKESVPDIGDLDPVYVSRLMMRGCP